MEKHPKKNLYITESLGCTPEIIQHCKSTTVQFKKKKSKWLKASWKLFKYSVSGWKPFTIPPCSMFYCVVIILNTCCIFAILKTKKMHKWPAKHQFDHSWATTHEQKIISEHGTGKLWRNTSSFLESNKGDLGIKFHWRALNKPAEWTIKLSSGKYEN